MFRYTRATGLGKITGIIRGTYKVSGPSSKRGGSQILDLEGSPEKRHET